MVQVSTLPNVEERIRKGAAYMKQCAGCGKRYAAAQATCPSCYSRSWVFAPDENAPAPLPDNPTPCSECGYMADAGTAKCPHCKARLRPRELEWLCILGLIGGPAMIGYIIYNIHNIGLRASLWSIGDVLLFALMTAICVGLLRGRYQAWRWARILMIAMPASLIVAIVIAEIIKDMAQASTLAGVLLFRFIGVALLWIYFNTPVVQDYCAQGKPVEHETAKALFRETEAKGHVDKLDKYLSATRYY